MFSITTLEAPSNTTAYWLYLILVVRLQTPALLDTSNFPVCVLYVWNIIPVVGTAEPLLRLSACPLPSSIVSAGIITVPGCSSVPELYTDISCPSLTVLPLFFNKNSLSSLTSVPLNVTVCEGALPVALSTSASTAAIFASGFIKSSFDKPSIFKRVII